MKSGKLLQTLLAHKNYVNSVVITSDNSKIISGSLDKTVKIWDIVKLNNKALIEKKIQKLQKSLGMRVEGVVLVPLEESGGDNKLLRR
jgi:WD40 repeat protein